MSDLKSREGTVRRQLAYRERVLRRQPSASAWGPSYMPAIEAVKEEAPGGSSPSAFFSYRLQRKMHALSRPEAFFLAISLYHPKVWDVHENHVLSPWPAEHPLANHPLYRDRAWPATNGTIRILEEKGMLSRHPRVPKMTVVGEGGSIQISDGAQVLPWLGDILLFMLDELDRPYLVELDVKDVTGRHGQPWAGGVGAGKGKKARAHAELREAAYSSYMDQLCVPIKRVARDQVPSIVDANFIRLAKVAGRRVKVPDTMAFEVIQALAESVGTGDLPRDVIARLVSDPAQRERAEFLLEHGIFDRRIRVDFWEPFLIDYPLFPERVDVVEHFAEWFSSGVYV